MPLPIDRRALLGAAAASAIVTVAPRAHAQDAAKPAAPTTPMPPIEVYARTPLIDEIALSPNGKRCAVVTQKGDDKFLMTETIDGKDKKVIALGPEKVRSLFWLDDSHVVLTDSLTTSLPEFVGRRQELYVARTINTDTVKASTLFGQEEGFYPMVMGELARIKTKDGYRVTASNFRREGDFPLFLYSFPPDSGHGRPISEGSRDTEGWVVGPDGYIYAMSEFDEDTKNWTLSFNMAAPGQTTNLKPIYKMRSALESPNLMGIGRDGKSVVIQLNEGFDNGRFHEIGAEGKLSDPIDADHEDKPRWALFHPVTGRLAGFMRHDNWFTYDYFDPLMKKLNDAIAETVGPDYRISHAGFADDPRKMILYGESANDAGSYFFADFSTGAVSLLSSNYPDLPEEWITQKQAIHYKAADGLDIQAYLTLPPFKDAKNLPLVVLPHGGPESRDYIDFDWQTQALASRGYAVLQPNFRGSSGYGPVFSSAGHGEWGGKMQTDLSDGVRYLAAQGTIDPKRVAIMGASYGGYAALAGATLDPGVYKCAVAIAGPSDLREFMDFELSNSNTRKDTRMLYWQEFLGDKKRYDAISPARQAAKAYCPILLIHGTDDTVVPIQQSQMMERALKAAGKTVEFVTYKGQDHWETRGTTRVAMMQAAVDFLAKYNPA